MASAVTAQGSQGAILARAGRDAFAKLDPRKLTGNPVILVTEVVAVLATLSTIAAFLNHAAPGFAQLNEGINRSRIDKTVVGQRAIVIDCQHVEFHGGLN